MYQIEDYLLESLPAAATVRQHLDRLAAEQALLRQLLALALAREAAEARLARGEAARRGRRAA